MKNTLKGIRIGLFIAALLFILPAGKAFAAVQYQILNERQNVTCDKVWNIKLNMDVDSASINGSDIKVVDEEGNPVSLNISYVSDSETIIVAPTDKYEQGKTYTLIIQDLRSRNGIPLKLPVKMRFTTISDTAGQSGDSYSLVDTHSYEITDVISVKGPAGSEYSLTYDLGTPSSSPYQKETDMKVEGPGAAVTTTDSGAKQLNAEAAVSNTGTTEYKVVRTIQNSGIKYTSDISKTLGDYSNFKDYTKYTSPEEKIQSDDPSIKEEAQQLFNGITNPYQKAKKAFEFVNSYMTYDTADGNKGALSALQTGEGVCEDYAELFTALLRASGVPCRIATGFRVEPQDFTGSAAYGDEYRHAWPEFYLPEYGWIVVEPTFTYTVNGIKEIDYSNFANLDYSGHFIEGYNIDGDYVDTALFWSSRGDITMEEHSYIKRLN